MNKLRFGDLFDYEKKSKIKAGNGLKNNEGKYPLFTSSNTLSKSINNFTFSDSSLIFGTGGMPSVHFCDDEFAVSTDCLVAQPIDKTAVFVKYVYYFFTQNNMRLLEEGFKGAGLKHISRNYIDKLQIPLPSIKIQQHIACILDDAAALRNKTAQLLEEYDLLAQSIFLEMFGDPVLNEKKWEVKKLEKVCAKITDGTHQGPKFRTEGIPFLLVSNIVNNEVIYETKKFIDDEEYTKLTKSTKIEVGDLLYTSVGSYGNPAIVRDVRKFCFQRHIAHIKVKSELINVTFLHAMMKSPLIKRQADRFAVGAAQKTLNLKTIRNFEIFHPPLDKQNQFAEKIAIIEQQKKIAKQELQESEDLFNCLLQKAFKGELV